MRFNTLSLIKLVYNSILKQACFIWNMKNPHLYQQSLHSRSRAVWAATCSRKLCGLLHTLWSLYKRSASRSPRTASHWANLGCCTYEERDALRMPDVQISSFKRVLSKLTGLIEIQLSLKICSILHQSKYSCHVKHFICTCVKK